MKATNSLIEKLRAMLPEEAHPVLDSLDGMLGSGEDDEELTDIPANRSRPVKRDKNGKPNPELEPADMPVQITGTY